MKQDSVSLKTMAIKARVYNHIRKTLYKKKLEELTPVDKENFLQAVYNLNKDAHKELNAYKSKRKYKSHIQRLRAERKSKAA